jgi:hypothetical protein
MEFDYFSGKELEKKENGFILIKVNKNIKSVYYFSFSDISE